MSENSVEESGLPTESETPLMTPRIDQVSDEEIAETEGSDGRKGILPLVLFIVIVVVIVGGMLGGAAWYLTNTKDENVIPVGSTQLSKAVEGKQENTDEPPYPSNTGRGSDVVEPLLPEVTVGEPPITHPGFDIGTGLPPGNKRDEKKNENGFKDILAAINAVNERLDTIEQAVGDVKAQLRPIERNSENAASDVKALIGASEVIIDNLSKQVDSVNSVKKLVVDEQQKNKLAAKKPAFRVSGRSLWGDTVYLTIATNNNFEQQAVIGSDVSGWTLKSIALKERKSLWVNSSGDEYELQIP